MTLPYGFGFTDALVAENAGVTLKALHFDIEAILQAYEALRPLAQALQVPVPAPRLAGFGYAPLAALGAPVDFPDDGEPKVAPLLSSPAGIDALRAPGDYLAAPLIRERLRLAAELRRRCPQASPRIGHPVQGPLTNAILLLGEEFLTLPYDDPVRAHRLLTFCVETGLQYADAIYRKVRGSGITAGPAGLPDDFAGLFPPALFGDFVVPYWNALFEGLRATRRRLHSELLQEAHLPFLSAAHIACFDPSADQYLTPEGLQHTCPCPFVIQIMSWHIRDMTADQLAARYEAIAACGPQSIFFYMNSMQDLPKIKRLLATARRLAGEDENGLPRHVRHQTNPRPA